MLEPIEAWLIMTSELHRLMPSVKVKDCVFSLDSS